MKKLLQLYENPDIVLIEVNTIGGYKELRIKNENNLYEYIHNDNWGVALYNLLKRKNFKIWLSNNIITPKDINELFILLDEGKLNNKLMKEAYITIKQQKLHNFWTYIDNVLQRIKKDNSKTDL